MGFTLQTITSLLNLFAEVLLVLAYVEEDEFTLSNQNQAFDIFRYFKTLYFVFYLYLMYEVLHLTDVLSGHLQRKD